MLIVEQFWTGGYKQTGADDFNPTKRLARSPLACVLSMRALEKDATGLI
jgi:hypothetical protein